MDSGKTYAEAKQICESATIQGGGWELCTMPELLSGICCGTGCDYDYMTNVWTKTPATPRLMRSACDPTAQGGANYTLATSTAMATALCQKNAGTQWQKCHANKMSYDHAVRCCDYDGGSCTTATRLGCESAVDWYEAHEACHEMGKRLCSLSEMDDDKCCVSGCMFDVDKVWTSTSSPI